MTDRPASPRSGAGRKSRDRALVLPLVGVLLLLPPVAGIFRLETTLFGVPATLVYVFAVWALLIAGTAQLSRRLGAELGAERDAADRQDGREGG